MSPKISSVLLLAAVACVPPSTDPSADLALDNALHASTPGAAALSGSNEAAENLGGVNFGGPNLGGPNLGGTNLGGNNLVAGNFGGANLGGTNLGGTNLGGPNLGGTNLGGTNLGGTNLGGTNLGGTNLGGTNLGGTNLGGTNLGGTNLGGTNLGGTNLGGTNLGGTNFGVNIHGLGSATGMLFSGEDLLPDRNSACIVLGLGSTAFARLVAQNTGATMYAAMGKLPWGFSDAPGNPVKLDAWEVLVWGSNSYCSFVVAAPPGVSWAGAEGFLKAVFRWTAPQTKTLQVAAFDGSQAVRTHTGMMDAGRYVLAKTITEKVYLAGEMTLIAATTNNISVNVDFATVVRKIDNNSLILGRVTGAPLELDGQFLAFEDAITQEVYFYSKSFDADIPLLMYGALSSGLSAYQKGLGAAPLAKRCVGAVYLGNSIPIPPGKCDDFSLFTSMGLSGSVYGAIPKNLGINGGVAWPNASAAEAKYQMESPDGVVNMTAWVPAGAFNCPANTGYLYLGCSMPMLAQTYTQLNEAPFTAVGGPAPYAKFSYGFTKNFIGTLNAQNKTPTAVTMTVTNVGDTTVTDWALRADPITYGVPDLGCLSSTTVAVGTLAPGATTTVTAILNTQLPANVGNIDYLSGKYTYPCSWSTRLLRGSAVAELDMVQVDVFTNGTSGNTTTTTTTTTGGGKKK